MRALMMVVLFSFALQACQVGNSEAPVPDVKTLISSVKHPDFDTEIKPIFQARCQPCHFQGGKVYEKLPFDKPETITRLGTKLFTRIKDEKERALIREFLDQK
jgi:hypothetical protein